MKHIYNKTTFTSIILSPSDLYFIFNLFNLVAQIFIMKHHNKCVLISPLLNYNTGFISITFSDPFGPSNAILKLEIMEGVDIKFMHIGATSWNHINFCVKHLGQTSLLTLSKAEHTCLCL